MVVNESNCLFSKMDILCLEECINNHMISYQSKININEDVIFGLEIEFDGIKYEKFKKIYNISESNDWKLEVEGTVPYGAEIISPPLINLKNDWYELKKICEFIKSKGGYIDELCGGHIHIATQVLGDNLNHWINFLKLWSVYEPVIYSFLLGEQGYLRNGIWTNARPLRKDLCQFLNNSFESTADLVNRIPFKTKQYGINFYNVSDLEYKKDKNTIEFRSPNGSLNEVVWQNNINLIIKMIIYSKSDDFDNDLIDYKFNALKNKLLLLKDYYNIDIIEALEFVDLIFNNNVDKIAFMKQYINKDLSKKVKII